MMERKMALVSLALICAVGMAQAGVILEDGFEAADTFTGNGWMLTGAGTVAEKDGWQISTGTSGNPGHYIWGGGNNTAEPDDIVSGTLSKDTGYAIQADDILTLTFDIRDLAPTAHDSAILASLYYVDGSVDVVLGSVEYLDDDIPWGWNDAMGTLTAEATTGAVGKNLFVAFSGGPSSHNGTSAQRLGIDNVVIEAVPEPATLSLLSLGGLLALKCRRS